MIARCCCQSVRPTPNRSSPAPSVRLTIPLTLDDIRESVDFQPPRSYRYVSRNTLRALVNGHPAGAPLLSLLRG
jgi:hypothetical protein